MKTLFREKLSLFAQVELATSVSQSAATNQSLVRLRELQSAAQSSRTLYDNFLERYMDAVQQESYPTTEARLITPAVVPSAPSKPSRIGIMGASLLGGFLISFGAAALRELLDGVFRSATQAERSLGLSCLATLPRLKPGKPPRGALVARARHAEPLPGGGPTHESQGRGPGEDQLHHPSRLHHHLWPPTPADSSRVGTDRKDSL